MKSIMILNKNNELTIEAMIYSAFFLWADYLSISGYYRFFVNYQYSIWDYSVLEFDDDTVRAVRHQFKWELPKRSFSHAGTTATELMWITVRWVICGSEHLQTESRICVHLQTKTKSVVYRQHRVSGQTSLSLWLIRLWGNSTFLNYWKTMNRIGCDKSIVEVYKIELRKEWRLKRRIYRKRKIKLF